MEVRNLKGNPALRDRSLPPESKEIARLDLGQFEKPHIEGNRGLVWRAAWYLVNALFFQGAILGLLPSEAKATLLRIFGAKVGFGLVCKPRVSIKYPWFLEIGDHVWLGEQVWIDNHCPVRVGSNVCISQGSYLATGNHDWSDPRFRFFSRPITICDSVWITAFSVLYPGTHIPEKSVWLGQRGCESLWKKNS